MGERQALRLVRELAGALQKLFETGQPHGNLKPSNIMLLPEGGGVRLLDIAFAWTLAWPDDTAAFAAAPDFLAPERIMGDLNVDARGDLYSLGAIWYRLITGEPVFRARTPEETLRMHLEVQPTPPRERDPRLSAATSGLILRLLKKDRDDRPRTPRDFLRRLDEHPLLGDGKKMEEAVGPPDE
jgi:serine/threonine-protein kinase